MFLLTEDPSQTRKAGEEGEAHVLWVRFLHESPAAAEVGAQHPPGARQPGTARGAPAQGPQQLLLWTLTPSPPVSPSPFWFHFSIKVASSLC